MTDLAPPARRIPKSDRGTTLSEVLIVLALSALIASPIYLVLQSAMRNERSQSQQLEIEAQLERVAGRLEDDIREGVPSERRTGDAATELVIWRTDNSGQQSLILWTVEEGDVRRQSYDLGTGLLVSDVVLLEGVSTSGPVFRYWQLGGEEVGPAAEVIYRCTARVTVDLQIAVDGVAAGRIIDVAHRTENSEAPPC